MAGPSTEVGALVDAILDDTVTTDPTGDKSLRKNPISNEPAGHPNNGKQRPHGLKEANANRSGKGSPDVGPLKHPHKKQPPSATVTSRSGKNNGEGSSGRVPSSDTRSQNSEMSELRSMISSLTTSVSWMMQNMVTFDDAEEDFPDRSCHDTAAVESADAGDVRDVPVETAQTADKVADPFDNITEFYSIQEVTGPPVSEKLASLINSLAQNKLTSAKLTEKMQKYQRPANCEFMSTLKVNEEIWHKMNDTARGRDLGLQKVSNALQKSLVPLTRATNTVISLAKKEITSDDVDFVEIMGLLVDSVALASTACGELNTRRRELIRPCLSEAYYRQLCSTSQQHIVNAKAYLFGDQLAETVKLIGDANLLTQKLAPAPPRMARRDFFSHPEGRFQPYDTRGRPREQRLGRFRGRYIRRPRPFLENSFAPSFRRGSRQGKRRDGEKR